MIITRRQRLRRSFVSPRLSCPFLRSIYGSVMGVSKSFYLVTATHWEFLAEKQTRLQAFQPFPWGNWRRLSSSRPPGAEALANFALETPQTTRIQNFSAILNNLCVFSSRLCFIFLTHTKLSLVNCIDLFEFFLHWSPNSLSWLVTICCRGLSLVVLKIFTLPKE